ncbi:Metallo-dependent phosphatase-like protein [Syncephalis fuscata]|nr:Metallo-dependent phosphatase-like protein [Syncephalis fuscata]
MLSLLKRRTDEQESTSNTSQPFELHISALEHHESLVSVTAATMHNTLSNQAKEETEKVLTAAFAATLSVSADGSSVPLLSSSPSTLSFTSAAQDDDAHDANTCSTVPSLSIPFSDASDNKASVYRSSSTSSMPLFTKKPILIYKEANGFLEAYSNVEETPRKKDTAASSANKKEGCNDADVSDNASQDESDINTDISNDDVIMCSRPSFASVPSLRPRRGSSLDSLTYTSSAAATAMEVSMTLAENEHGETEEKPKKKKNILAPVLSIRASTWPALSEPHSRRNIAIGDLHGDLVNSKAVLKMAGLVNDEGRWIGGRDRMIQLGDVADRGPDTLALFRYLYQLRKEAAAAGGEVVLIMGNHELMTLMHKKHRLQLPFMRDPFNEHGEIGRWLKHLPIMQVIDGTVYAHGGVSPYWAKLGCERTNLQAQRSMKNYMHSGDLLAAKLHYPVFGDNGPAWYRRYAYDKDEQAVSELLDEALQSLGARRMVAAHSPTRSPKMHVRCNGKFIDIDTKISRFFKWPDGTPDGNHLSALEIIGDQVTAIYPSGRELISDGSTD